MIYLRSIRTWIFVFYVIAILFLSIQTSENLSLFSKFWKHDKIIHFIEYLLLGFLLINALIIILIFNVELKLFNNTQLITNIPLLNLKDLHFTNKFIVFIWTIFITVGIWRSAENYRGKFIWIVLTLIALSYRIFILKVIFY